MEKVIYLKKVDDYEDIIKKKRRISNKLKKLIYLIKNIFNIITLKNEELNICVLPFKEKVSLRKLDKIIKKISKNKYLLNSKFVICNDLIKVDIKERLDMYKLSYFDGNKIKQMLTFKILEYINDLQKKEANTREITILCNEYSEVNQFIINKLAFEYKVVRIVSKKIYQFKKLEEILYNENGIAIQLSNSYKKSLKKTDLILNLDFNTQELNEYEINLSAIIVNIGNKVKIKSKLFNGIIINSCKIKFSENIRQLFTKEKLLHRYDMLILYESLVDWKSAKYESIIEKIANDQVHILNLIGNNGIINKKEFKIVK